MVEGETEVYDEGTITLKGVCSYDPTTKSLSEFGVRTSNRRWRRASRRGEQHHQTR
jgi:hypothetical protein